MFQVLGTPTLPPWWIACGTSPKFLHEDSAKLILFSSLPFLWAKNEWNPEGMILESKSITFSSKYPLSFQKKQLSVP